MSDDNLRIYYFSVSLALAALICGILAFANPSSSGPLIARILFPALTLAFVLLLLSSRRGSR